MLLILLLLIIFYLIGLGFFLGEYVADNIPNYNRYRATQFEQFMITLFIPLIVISWFFYFLYKCIKGEEE